MKAFAAISSADKSQTHRHNHAESVRRLPVNVSANGRRDDTRLQRKASCACSGGCPRCAAEPEQPDASHVGQPEQEAEAQTGLRIQRTATSEGGGAAVTGLATVDPNKEPD